MIVGHELVTKLDGFTTWGTQSWAALFKNEMWLPQNSFLLLAASREDGIHIQSSVPQTGSLAIASLYYLVNYIALAMFMG